VFSLSTYDYDLPQNLIAQEPLEKRDHSRLLVLNRSTGHLSHHRFFNIVDLLAPDDVLILNNTRVVPCRLLGKKSTGGKIEILILGDTKDSKQHLDQDTWVYSCLVKASKPPAPGNFLEFDQGLKGEVLSGQQGIYTIRFHYNGDFQSLLDYIGKVPLPPYIRRPTGDKESKDKSAYQTVYASQKGAVAAPTAGFHFTQTLLKTLKEKSIKVVEITLHVGYGTFSPVRVTDIRDHILHSESYYISEKSAAEINTAKEKGARIVAVGTTCVRCLEYASDNSGRILSGSGTCDLFIYPGYRFKVVDAMITNFHLPKSTLLMLVSAFCGIEKLMKAYTEAIERKYRFYSYGDAMFIA